jgi:hypothetical protein
MKGVNMLDKKTREKLAKAITKKFPRNLTKRQADWWIENDDYLPDALSALAQVEVVLSSARKLGE